MLLLCSRDAGASVIDIGGGLSSSSHGLRGLLSASGGSSTNIKLLSPIGNDGSGSDDLPEINLSGAILASLGSDDYFRGSSLSGYVYVDADNNGYRGPYDVVFVGAEMKAASQADPTNVYTAETDNDGMFYFGGLVPGTYTLWQSMHPENFIDGKDTVGRLIDVVGHTISNTTCGIKQDADIHDSMIVQIQLHDGYHGIDYNFAERGLTAAAVSKRLLLASTPETVVPEPSTLTLLVFAALGACGVAPYRRRRQPLQG
jgi:hypothetical protein